jgi:hypothetical protein
MADLFPGGEIRLEWITGTYPASVLSGRVVGNTVANYLAHASAGRIQFAVWGSHISPEIPLMQGILKSEA